MSRSLFLLDGMALVYRAHFAFISRPIVNSRGLNLSAVFGFANTLLDILENQRPSHIAVAFDTPAPTPRHVMYPEYKAQRDAMPEDIGAAIPKVKRLLASLGIPVLEHDGAEADDIIGTLARQAEAAGFEEIFMVTPDKDFGQLVDEHTRVYKPGRQGAEVEILGPAEVCAQWGIVRPEQVVDVLALMGDSSDNIPGVPGVGPKTAQKLIADFDNVENLLANTDKVKGKVAEKLREFAEQARLCRRLAEIHCEVPLGIGPNDLRRGDRDEAELQALLTEFEFHAMARRLFGESLPPQGPMPPPVQGDLFFDSSSPPPPSPPSSLKRLADVPHNYRLIDGLEQLEEAVTQIQKAGRFSFDLETTGLDVLDTEIVAVALACEEGSGWLLPVPANDERRGLDALRPLWEDGTLLKIGHNLKFDLGVLAAHGVEVAGPFADTMVAHALLEPELRHGMDTLAVSLLGYEPIPIADLIGPRGAEQRNMRDVPLDNLTDYAVEDADVTLRLFGILLPRLATEGQTSVFERIEMPLLPVLQRMEAEGIRVDSTALEAYSLELGARLSELEHQVHALAGETFNLNSPKQLGVVLFEKLKLSEKTKKTRTGQYSTDEQTLLALAGTHPILDAILEHREIGKLKSTYVDALPRQVHPKTGRIHTRFLQTGAATGRLSSVDPNVQNIPIRTERGREIRRAFVARAQGWSLLAADYSQIELRIMAHLSGDEGLKEAFSRGHDIHAATAAKVYGIPLQHVDSEMRRKAKMVNFGIIYGISAFGLSQRLGIPREEAGQIIQAYFMQYPQVREFMDRVVRETRERGYIETLSGRRRIIRDIASRNNTLRQAAERTAINSPIQGSAADMIKIAMVEVDRLLREGGYRSRLLLQVHDELVFDLYDPEADQVIPLVRKAMETALPLDVPVLVETGTGPSWLDAH